MYVDSEELQVMQEPRDATQEEPRGSPGSLLELKRIDEVYDSTSGEWTQEPHFVRLIVPVIDGEDD